MNAEADPNRVLIGPIRRVKNADLGRLSQYVKHIYVLRSSGSGTEDNFIFSNIRQGWPGH